MKEKEKGTIHSLFGERGLLLLLLYFIAFLLLLLRHAMPILFLLQPARYPPLPHPRTRRHRPPPDMPPLLPPPPPPSPCTVGIGNGVERGERGRGRKAFWSRVGRCCDRRRHYPMAAAREGKTSVAQRNGMGADGRTGGLAFAFAPFSSSSSSLSPFPLSLSHTLVAQHRGNEEKIGH